VPGRFLFVCGALLALANVVLGETYQRTRDGKTLVWNNHPKPGDEATWSGGRDRDGYARGFGTLTWYTTERADSGLAKPELYAHYWGNMIRGKLNGPVNVHSKRKTHYAIFADGARLTRWAAGPAPSRIVRPDFVAAIKKQRALVAREAENVERRTWNAELSRTEMRAAEPQAPAEGPRRPQIDIDNSLRVLALPPRSLRVRRLPRKSANPEDSPSRTTARLTKEEVIVLADASARSRGYDLNEYERPEPQYDAADQTWSLLYDQKPVGETAGKHFTVAVNDKTKNTALVAGR
jgi:hypothetical protein